MSWHKRFISVVLSITLITGSLFSGFAFADDGRVSGGFSSGERESGGFGGGQSTELSALNFITGILGSSSNDSLFSYISNMSNMTDYLPTMNTWLQNIYSRLSTLDTISQTLLITNNNLGSIANLLDLINRNASAILEKLNNWDNNNDAIELLLENNLGNIQSILNDLTFIEVGREDHFKVWSLPELLNDIRLSTNGVNAFLTRLSSKAEIYGAFTYYNGFRISMSCYVQGGLESGVNYTYSWYQLNHSTRQWEHIHSDSKSDSLRYGVDADMSDFPLVFYCEVTGSNGFKAVSPPYYFSFAEASIPYLIYETLLEMLDNGSSVDGSHNYSDALEGIQETLDKILGGIVVLDILTLWNTVIGSLDFDFLGGQISELTTVLRKAFPFSLAFDVVAIFGLFSAEPIAPSIVVPFPDGTGNTIEQNFSLEQFDSLAAGFRILVTISFCLGLAFITRNFIFKTGGGD